MTNNTCTTDAGREARRQYQREWRARNRERIAEYNRTYWQRKAEAAQSGNREETVNDTDTKKEGREE